MSRFMTVSRPLVVALGGVLFASCSAARAPASVPLAPPPSLDGAGDPQAFPSGLDAASSHLAPPVSGTDGPGGDQRDRDDRHVARPPEVTRPVDAGGALPDPVQAAGVVQRVRGGFGFTEGPVWVSDRGYLLFSDLSTHTIHKLTPPAAFEVFRQPSQRSNGLGLDPQGRLVVCETATRRVTRTERDGSSVVLTDAYFGRPYTRPNDVIVRRDGNIYFTDINVALYRIDPTGKVHLVSEEIRPNGVALSPDEDTLYATHNPRAIWSFPLDAAGTPGPGKRLAELPASCDGMAVDDAGNLYTTVEEGVLVLRKDGTRWGTIPVPERPANCTFGDADRKTLYITARTGLYRVRLAIPGLP
jgi:gluconolactonase